MKLGKMSEKEKNNLFNELGLWLHEELGEDGKETGYFVWENDETNEWSEYSFTTPEEARDNAIRTILE